MPRSKVRTPKKETPKQVKDPRVPDRFYCTCCGRSYKTQDNKFAPSQSKIYQSNNGRITVCYQCVIGIYDDYLKEGLSEEEAVRRICMKFDAYFHPDLISLARKHYENTKSLSLIQSYLSKSGLRQFKDKSFDNTLYEEYHKSGEYMLQLKYSQEAAKEKEKVLKKELKKAKEQRKAEEKEFAENTAQVTDEMRRFWGDGWDDNPKAILFFDDRYHQWTDNVPDMDTSLEAIYKQICMLEYKINECYQTGSGKPTDYISALNSLLASANIKPSQVAAAKKSKEDDMSNASLSEMLRYWEDVYKKPVIEPDPEFQDVDGVRKLIFVFFLGHLCKMLKIKNKYSKAYEEEMAKYTVQKPVYEEDDESAVSDSIFGDSSATSE